MTGSTISIIFLQEDHKMDQTHSTRETEQDNQHTSDNRKSFLEYLQDDNSSLDELGLQSMKLFSYLLDFALQLTDQATKDTNTRFKPEYISSFPLGHSVRSIAVNFNPETLYLHNNLKFLLYRSGYNYHNEKTYISRSDYNRNYYFKLRCTDCSGYSGCSECSTLPQNNYDNNVKIILSETYTDNVLRASGLKIEEPSKESIPFIEKCISQSGLEYKITDIEYSDHSEYCTYKSNDQDNQSFTINIIKEAETPDYDTIIEAVNHLKHNKIWIE